MVAADPRSVDQVNIGGLCILAMFLNLALHHGLLLRRRLEGRRTRHLLWPSGCNPTSGRPRHFRRPHRLWAAQLHGMVVLHADPASAVGSAASWHGAGARTGGRRRDLLG